jgi:hypothetical protein
MAGLWRLYNGLPHMDALDALSAKLSYARRLYATDLRPLRKYLSRCSAPMLILHGNRNALATASAVRMADQRRGFEAHVTLVCGQGPDHRFCQPLCARQSLSEVFQRRC